MRTEDIQPLSEHRAHLTEHIRRVQESGRPMFITSNGRTAAVVMSPRQYDRIMELAAIAENLTMIDRSRQDIESGRTADARQAIKSIAQRQGIELEQ